jgi:hypothetical protein
MRKQTLIWTALPNGSDGPLQAGTQLNISVYVSPRLWSDTPQVIEELGDYPDFLDWPAAVSQASFEVEFGSGQILTAAHDTTPLRSDLWQALFNANTPVIPFVFEDFSGMDFQGDQLSVAHAALKGVYQDIATGPPYGQGTQLPKASDLSTHPILEVVGRPYEPQPPLPKPPPQEPVVIEGHPPPEAPTPGEPPGVKPGCIGGCFGCLTGCLLLPFRIVLRILRLLGALFTLPFAAVTPAQAHSSMNAVVDFHKPFTEVPQPMPTEQEIEETYDFHKMVSALGDYPLLLRAMGLVVDLTVTLEEPLPAGTSTVKVNVNIPVQMAATTMISMKVHYDLGADTFQARPRPTDPEISNGLLRLNEADKFEVIQVDATGGVIKLFNLASNLRLLANPALRPENSPEEAGLPALRNGGLSLVKPNRAENVHLQTIQSYAYNTFTANLDASPILPLSAPEPPPPPTDELFAEDVTRGYRIDVLDDQTSQWRSLCQRVGEYDFGSGLVESGWQDEGFVVLGATGKLDPGPTDNTMRIGETLISWDGWSLVAPRPGQIILDEYEDPEKTVNKTDYPSNPAVTVFPLSTHFQAVNGSLPRLRFGHEYRLRARVVDLAGNSIFEPGEADFQADQAQKSSQQVFSRFDPVSPPPVVLREEPKEGESLERIVVRSSIHQDSPTIAALMSERHIVPPKASQLMAEQHGLFDGAHQMLSDQAAYDLASREAGSLMEQLNLATGELEPAPGAVEVVQFELDPVTNQPVLDENGDPIVLGKVWLQTNEQFSLNYLPDPFARGVLLLGLPGMASFDEVVEPDGTVVNKIPFEGEWPDPAPLRLQLRGLKDGQAGPAVPSWDPADRVLTVELHQGMTANVQISSYFFEDDLEKMGVWQWTEETLTPNLANLKTIAVQGRNWMVQPFRTLVLVHAVQQPLAIPDITALASEKELGKTYTTLTGAIAVDGKSTGKLDLLAEWADPLDNPSDPANDPTSAETRKQMYVKEILLEDGSSDSVDIGGPKIEAIQHELNDTKRHLVTYQSPGTTRFREYMDPAVLATPAELMRPTPAELGTPPALDAMFEVDVANSARPDSPSPVHVLPVFPWSETSAGDVITHFREGGWVRVYLERPWFSSGVGELLGVLLRTEDVDPLSDLAEAMKPYTSQWGNDPVWDSARVEPLQLEHLANADDSGKELPLAELKRGNSTDGRVVNVAGFKPEYDPARGLWFCDISFDPGQALSYFPFVRLALARFQPHSLFSDDGLDSAHLSRAVLADYVQLAPHRRVDYDLKDVQTNGILDITVRGPVGFRLERPTVMLVNFARRDPRVPDPQDELGWAEFGNRMVLELQGSSTPEQATWSGKIPLPSPQPSPLRVLVRELELFQGGDDTTVVIPGTTGGEQPTPSTGTFDFPRFQERVVFADALELP